MHSECGKSLEGSGCRSHGGSPHVDQGWHLATCMIGPRAAWTCPQLCLPIVVVLDVSAHNTHHSVRHADLASLNASGMGPHSAPRNYAAAETRLGITLHRRSPNEYPGFSQHHALGCAGPVSERVTGLCPQVSDRVTGCEPAPCLGLGPWSPNGKPGVRTHPRTHTRL